MDKLIKKNLNRFEELQTIIKNIRNHKKIKDMSNVLNGIVLRHSFKCLRIYSFVTEHEQSYEY